MSKIIYFFKQSWLMMIATFFFGFTLALAQTTLGPMIEKQEQIRMDQLMQELIIDATSFHVVVENLEVNPSKGQTLTTTIYQAQNADGHQIGYAFTAEGPGWSGEPIKLVIALDNAFDKIIGFKVLSCRETPNLGDRIRNDEFRMQFAGANVETFEIVKAGNLNEIDKYIVAISGATSSSKAVVDIFNKYLIPVKVQLQIKGLI